MNGLEINGVMSPNALAAAPASKVSKTKRVPGRRKKRYYRFLSCAASRVNSSNGDAGDVLQYWQDLGVAQRETSKLLDLAKRRPKIYANVDSLKARVSELARLLPPEADIGRIVSEAPKVLSNSAAEIASTIVALSQLLDTVQRLREGCDPSVSVDHLIYWRPGALCMHPKDIRHVVTLVSARPSNEIDAELAMMVAIWCATENPDFFLRDPSWAQLDEEMKDKRGRPRDVSIASMLTMFPPAVWQSMDGYEKQRLLGVLGLGDARFYDW